MFNIYLILISCVRHPFNTLRKLATVPVFHFHNALWPQRCQHLWICTWSHTHMCLCEYHQWNMKYRNEDRIPTDGIMCTIFLGAFSCLSRLSVKHALWLQYMHLFTKICFMWIISTHRIKWGYIIPLGDGNKGRAFSISSNDLVVTWYFLFYYSTLLEWTCYQYLGKWWLWVKG